MTILGRGRTYYNASRVKNLSKNNSCHSAVVTGTEEYNVVISYEDDKIASMTCNCPYAQSGERCKHMAAVLYAAYGDGSIKKTSDPIPGGHPGSDPNVWQNPSAVMIILHILPLKIIKSLDLSD